MMGPGPGYSIYKEDYAGSRPKTRSSKLIADYKENAKKLEKSINPDPYEMTTKEMCAYVDAKNKQIATEFMAALHQNISDTLASSIHALTQQVSAPKTEQSPLPKTEKIRYGGGRTIG